ncbi:peptidase M56 [Vallitalea pronyensis]|uniref:Peptidase M56 n=1 Tax=Vallitalea pronyensis TaxID=1348613 RepID=A0A8J8MMW2_9FIRM|nr:peptidase M56 [Vallitalea pronyensis]QUI24600.1 peptidase M56 [Vallitalea pronyensis]
MLAYYKNLMLYLLYEHLSKHKISVQETSDWKDYMDQDYHVALKYPSDWQKNSKYSFRYGNEDGFFSFDAITGDDLSLDQVTELDAYHAGNPYGSKPQIVQKVIQHQQARLILPSQDQPAITANQAGLIVTYPRPIQLAGVEYRYFILWAHKDYILPISQTITFI